MVGDRSSDSDWTQRMLSILRIAIGFFFLCHGAQKLLGMPPMPPPPVGMPPPDMLAKASGYFELIGGTLMLLGLFTRPVAFILSGMMAVAYFHVHYAMGVLPLVNHGEPAVLYCFVFLYFAFAGGGPWSLDRLFAKKKY